MQTQSAFDFCQRPVRTKPQERLFFALMPDENGAFALKEFTDRFLFANDVVADRLKPMIVMQRLSEASGPVLFGAKLAGQAVPAAGLVLKFDTLLAEKRLLQLTSSDESLAALAQSLSHAIVRHGLKTDGGAPFLALAQGLRPMAPEKVKPIKLKVTGLALLRGEVAGEWQVLRRWPLNAATNRNLTGPRPAR